MFSKIVFSACFILIILVQTGSAAIDFGRVPLCVGKQLLTEKGFYLSQTLGIARITPQAEIPFILASEINSSMPRGSEPSAFSLSFPLQIIS